VGGRRSTVCRRGIWQSALRARVQTDKLHMSAERIDLYHGLIYAIDTPQALRTCFAALSSLERQGAESLVFSHRGRHYIFARFAPSNCIPLADPLDCLFAKD